MFRIVSFRDGFRRCGVAHSSAPTDWPDDRFSEEELEILGKDPMLKVGHIKGEPGDPETAPDPADPLGPQDIARIGAAIRTLGVEDYDKSGKPNVKKIQTAMGDDAFDFNAKARDRVWDDLVKSGFKAPEANA